MLLMVIMHVTHDSACRIVREMNEARSRRSVGESISPFSVATLSHGTLSVPSEGFTHLQFRRFAGCPICNLHLRTFAKQLPRLEQAGIRTVAFFHSSAETMKPYQGDLPFPVVPDFERRWYRTFGVERSLRAVLHPQAVRASLEGLASVPSSAFAGEGGMQGLPADFLVDGAGVIRALRYGAHANDQWSVEEVAGLALAAM
jgi:peroxiredoxin